MLLLTAILFEAAFFYFAIRLYTSARFLQNIPTAWIRSAPQGYIALKGKTCLLTGAPSYVPDLKIPCVWYECDYARLNESDGSVYVDTLRSKQSFLIDDGTGSCRIDPLFMTIIPRARRGGGILHSWFVWFFKPREGLITAQWLVVGEEVHAYGKFSTLHLDYMKQKDERFRDRLRALKKDPRALQEFDTDRDGNIDSEEWQAARRQVQGEVQDYLMEKQRLSGNPAAENVLCPPDNAKHPYVVTSYDGLGVVSWYKFFAFLCMLMFFLCGVVLVNPDTRPWLSSFG